MIDLNQLKEIALKIIAKAYGNSIDQYGIIYSNATPTKLIVALKMKNFSLDEFYLFIYDAETDKLERTTFVSGRYSYAEHLSEQLKLQNRGNQDNNVRIHF